MHPAAVMPGVVLASGVAAFSTFGAFIPDYSREVGLATSGGLFAVVLAHVAAGAHLRRDVARAARTAPRGHDRPRARWGSGSPFSPWCRRSRRCGSRRCSSVSASRSTIRRCSHSPSTGRATAIGAWAISSFTMFFEVGSVFGGLFIGGFAQAVGKQTGFFGGVLCCIIGLYLLRFKLVPAGSPTPAPPGLRGRPAPRSPATDGARASPPHAPHVCVALRVDRPVRSATQTSGGGSSGVRCDVRFPLGGGSTGAA